MDVLGDVVARDRRSDATALRVPALGRSYDYRRFCTSAWKVGNLLRHHGVRRGAGVAVADDPSPEPVLSLYGAATLGGVVQFAPARPIDDPIRAIVVPAGDVEGYDAGPGTKRIAYGDRPADPSVAYFERDVWSENPTVPPDRVDPADPLLATPAARYTHGDVLDAAAIVVDESGMGPGSTVAVDAAFTHPGAVVAGLVAPALAGATACVRSAADADVVVGDPGDVEPDAVLGYLESE